MTRQTNLIRRLVAGAPPIKVPDYHNMPKRFIDRHTDFTYYRAPNRPNFEKKVYRYKSSAYYDVWRPWEHESITLNKINQKNPKIFVEPVRHWSFFRGDRVEILKGPEKGMQGIINYIVKERNWVFVEGLNLERTIKDGIMYCREMPLLINVEVKHVDPSDLLPTDIEWRYNDKGERVRVSVRSERVIPIPASAYETFDCKDRNLYKESVKDTRAGQANKKTYEPQSKTFEMDICESMGIKEERVPHPMYWY